MTASPSISSSTSSESRAAPESTVRKAPAITLNRLHKRFARDAVALAGVDLTIQAGEFFTLLGPSGCGKTTLLRILAGLDAPDEGELTIGDQDITETPAHLRSVNTVFQSYALFPHLSVRDNIAFGLRMKGVSSQERRRRVDSIAEFTKLGSLVERRIDQLSGGQRQRVALARALVCEPDVLLLDEPLSALDAGLRTQLQVELQRMQKRLGMTFVFVTHDQDEAMVMSDRIAVLDSGVIQQVGPPHEVYERPVNAFVARFMGHVNLFDIQSVEGDRVVTALGVLSMASSISTDRLSTDKLSTNELSTDELSNDKRSNAELSAPSSSAEKRAGMVLIRQEVVELGHSVSAGYNGLDGIIKERHYRGSRIEYRLEVNGVTLMATASNLGQRLYAVNDAVTVSIHPEDVVRLDA